MKPGFDVADDLGDAALSQLVFFGELSLAQAGGLIVEINLLIALAGSRALASFTIRGSGDLGGNGHGNSSVNLMFLYSCSH